MKRWDLVKTKLINDVKMMMLKIMLEVENPDLEFFWFYDEWQHTSTM